MDAWRLWWEMARESEEAARLAEAGSCPRSAASRYYYAAYQAVTALLLYRRLPPPAGREAWSHIETPALLRDQLRSLIRSQDKRNGLAHRLFDLYQLRLIADYEGRTPVRAEQINQAGRDARYLLRIIDGLLPER